MQWSLQENHKEEDSTAPQWLLLKCSYGYCHHGKLNLVLLAFLFNEKPSLLFLKDPGRNSDGSGHWDLGRFILVLSVRSKMPHAYWVKLGLLISSPGLTMFSTCILYLFILDLRGFLHVSTPEVSCVAVCEVGIRTDPVRRAKVIQSDSSKPMVTCLWLWTQREQGMQTAS